MSIKLILKEYIKSYLQTHTLPGVYEKAKNEAVNEKLVILADAHHDSIPFSMELIYKYLKDNTDYEIKVMCCDFAHVGERRKLKFSKDFMRLYANARAVFICDNFLPAASCKKRPETKVIQLWHACGALKKFGYDATDSVPQSYRGGNVFSNTDIVTVSGEACVSPFSSAMRLPAEKVLPIGISRSDIYYDGILMESWRKEFYEAYPDAAGKKIVIWAPTFRGNAAEPKLCGEEEIDRLSVELGDEYLVIKSIHPHAASLRPENERAKLGTEKLLSVADVLISDYSSVIYDFLFFKKPFVLFTPDFEEYSLRCGFYENYDSLPGERATAFEELFSAVKRAASDPSLLSNEREAFSLRTMGACDGASTKRIIEKI